MKKIFIEEIDKAISLLNRCEKCVVIFPITTLNFHSVEVEVDRVHMITLLESLKKNKDFENCSYFAYSEREGGKVIYVGEACLD